MTCSGHSTTALHLALHIALHIALHMDAQVNDR